MIFGIIKEGISELMEERLRSFRAEIAASRIGTRSPSYREFKACGVPEFFGVKDLITSHRWITDMENSMRRQRWDSNLSYLGAELRTGGRRLFEL